ncbi:MAG: Rne/Rng family ribonuclease [Burkholderiaceae bacterium]
MLADLFTEEVFLQATPFEARAVRLIQGVVQEIEVERTAQRGHVGNIVMGRVSRVLPGMQAAFIDAGFARTGFLHVADVWQAKLQDGEALETPRPIERVLYEGQQLLVQVMKDPLGSKGARLSTQLSIAGRYLVYLPFDTRPDPSSAEPRIGISQKIEDPEARDVLKARLLALVPADEQGSFIARTQAEDASEEALANDIAYLRQRWEEIREASHQAAPGTVLYRELNLAQRVLRDWVGDRTTRVLVDDPYRIDGLRVFARQYMPSVMPRLENFTGDRPLFELHNIEQEIAAALKRRVDLKSGGYLIIDQTEAMATIDVNTGGYVSGRSFSETIFKTNLEAAQAIARQLRLRNLGGIILVDFIDMADETHREQVQAELGHALEHDRTKVRISGFTSLGLVELTRKRTRDSLAQQLSQTCPTCEGQGRIKTAQTICYEILREIARMAKQFQPREFRVMANPEVIERFLEEEAGFLNALIDEIGKPITLSVEGEIPPGGYDIALL